VTALAALETYRRRDPGQSGYGVADAVAKLVKFRDPVAPRAEWRAEYETGLAAFEKRLMM
jgi:hypothetical protein